LYQDRLGTNIGKALKKRCDRFLAGYEIRPEHYGGRGAGNASGGGTASSEQPQQPQQPEECGLAVAAALERLVRQVEGGDLDDGEQVALTVGTLVDRTARPAPPPDTAPEQWYAATSSYHKRHAHFKQKHTHLMCLTADMLLMPLSRVLSLLALLLFCIAAIATVTAANAAAHYCC
jgi:hypothetical protein